MPTLLGLVEMNDETWQRPDTAVEQHYPMWFADEDPEGNGIGPDIPGYELLELAGTGGAGLVYKARQERLDRHVAVKILTTSTLGASPESDLLGEARTAATIEHVNIVRVYEIGMHARCQYLAMEYLDGGTLADRLRKGPLEPRTAAELLQAIAAGVIAAHRKGVIHRDLKPQNVLLDRSGNPKITDFGLARQVETDEATGHTDHIVGTPQYMSPEQARGDGRQVGTSSDIYSMGAILYECLCGHPPFQACNPWTVVAQVIADDPPGLRKLNPALPRDLETICAKALQKEPARRYATAEEFSEDLGRWLADKPVRARPVSQWERAGRWCRRHPALAALSTAVVVMLVVGLLGIFNHNRSLAEKNRELREQRLATVQSRVQTVLNAHPNALSLAVDALQSDPSAVDPLRNAFDSDELEFDARLNAAVALATLGDPPLEFLGQSVSRVAMEPGRCENLLLAARHTQGQLDQRWRVEFDKSKSVDHQFRLAVLLSYTATGSVESALPSALDEFLSNGFPVQETYFVEQFPSWHGDWARWLAQAESIGSPHVLRATCLAIGNLDPRGLRSAERQTIETFLSRCYRQRECAGMHAAAGHALSAWRCEIPIPSPCSEDAQAAWYIGPHEIEMVLIPAGDFRLGDLTEQNENRPPRAVSITRPFYISSAEITEGQFHAFLHSGFGELQTMTRPVLPVGGVSFEQAVRFCNWLSREAGREPCYSMEESSDGSVTKVDCDFGANGFRLPTEAEWEYACRAGAETRYYFGDQDVLLAKYARSSNNRRVPLFRVRSLRPNAWGLFDMHGNVWEWCWDYFDEWPTTPVADPRGPIEPSPEFGVARVYRGGGAGNFSGDPDSCARGYASPDASYWNLGFRVVTNSR